MREANDPTDQDRSRRGTGRHPGHLGTPAREAAEEEPAEPERPAERRRHTRRRESPVRTAEQDVPAEVRPPTPDEEHGEDLEDLDDPSPARGPGHA